MSRAVSDRERELASELDRLFGEDAKLAERLNDAHQRLHETVCGWGIHPDGLAAVYGEDPAVVDMAFAENRSEVFGAPDPLAAVQQVHWMLCLHCTLTLSGSSFSPDPCRNL